MSCWLFTILRNVRLNQVRNRMERSSTIEMDEPGRRPEFQDKSLKDPLSLYLSKVKKTDVRTAIEKLPDAYREVIVLREFEELSYEVMSRLSRARDKLRDMLQHWNLITDEVANSAGE
jgi:RNA polymerase sigma-70 factor (ECF subfamily)